MTTENANSADGHADGFPTRSSAGSQPDKLVSKRDVFVRSAEWFIGQTPTQQTILRAVLVAAGTYGSVILSQFITSNLTGLGRIVVMTLSSLGLISLLLIIVAYVSQAIESVERATESATLEGLNEQAILNVARYFSEEELKDEVRWTTEVDTSDGHVTAPTDPLTLISRVVDSAYQLLETHYGQAGRLADTVDFEVTFMTLSYSDGGITIAAWANRDGYRPRSLQTRAGNPQQYDTTVTKTVFDDDRHNERIIEDTHDPKWSAHYKQYPGQRQRIRSAVVWPVLSSNYELLGTLVLHCDKPRFFVEQHRKFWKEVCSIYARRLALAKLRLDQAVLQDGDGHSHGPGAKQWPTPPF